MPRGASKGKAGGTANFEESAVRLEEIIGIIEEGDIPLDNALDLFAEGAAMAAYCAKRLNAARERVNVLTRDIDAACGGAGFKETPFSAE